MYVNAAIGYAKYGIEDKPWFMKRDWPAEVAT